MTSCAEGQASLTCSHYRDRIGTNRSNQGSHHYPHCPLHQKLGNSAIISASPRAGARVPARDREPARHGRDQSLHKHLQVTEIASLVPWVVS